MYLAASEHIEHSETDHVSSIHVSPLNTLHSIAVLRFPIDALLQAAFAASVLRTHFFILVVFPTRCLSSIGFCRT